MREKDTMETIKEEVSEREEEDIMIVEKVVSIMIIRDKTETNLIITMIITKKQTINKNHHTMIDRSHIDRITNKTPDLMIKSSNTIFFFPFFFSP
jgi:hypothetical protein